MRLSMWMIVNRLHNFDLEVHIQDQPAICLRSARRAYATNCVYVYQSGNDSVCKSGDDYFIIKDIDSQEAVEIIQSVFDYYEDWAVMIQEAIVTMNFQKVIDKSWHIFHNPIVLMDGNWNVIAIGNRYINDEIDEEWKHLSRYGSISMDVYSLFRNDPSNNFNVEGAHYYRMTNPGLSNCISCLITHNRMVYGRITVLEKRRELNHGDIQIMNYLIQQMSLAMALLEQQKKTSTFCSIYHNLLKGEEINETELLRQMEYRGWTNEKDYFYICVVRYAGNPKDDEESLLFKNQLSRLLSECEVDVFNHDIVIIANAAYSVSRIIEVIENLDKSRLFAVGQSLKFKDMHRCRSYYNQAAFAVSQIKTLGEAQNAPLTCFYDYAISFLILNQNQEDAIYACHPDIVKLWENDKAHGTERLKTFMVYLNNERSLITAAQELYVHRNTLVYRINKLFEQLEGNLEDAYTRDYMKLSYYVLELYDKINREENNLQL